MNISKNTNLWIYVLALLNVLIHLAVYGNFEYHRDELLYFSLGMHPAMGYASVPPLIGWLAFLIQAIGGFSLLAVKFVPALLGGFFLVLVASITKELGGNRYAQLLSGVGVLVMPVTLRAFHLYQPVPFDLFFWGLLTWLILRFHNSKDDKFLLWFGLVSGLAMLNKYLVVLFIFCLILSFLITGSLEIFKKKKLYFGALLGLLLFLPNLIWQMIMGFPVIEHMSALNEYQLVKVNRVDFLIDQLFISFGACFLIVLGQIYLLKNKAFRYLGVTTVLVFVILILLRGKSYYTIGVFPVLLGAGSVLVAKNVKVNWLKVLIPVLMISITLPILPMGFPFYKPAKMVEYFQNLEEDYGMTMGRRFEDGTIHSLPQDYADQLGWEELAAHVATAYEQVDNKEACLIYGENYGQAAAVSVIGKKYGLPEAVSFADSFRYWVKDEFDPDIQSFIYINDELGQDVEALFEQITIVGSISNVDAREFGTTVYLCEKPRSSFNEFWKGVTSKVGVNW